MDNLGANARKLISTVLEVSTTQDWKQAVMEWDIVDVIEDLGGTQSCVCGTHNLRYVFTIRNRHNGAVISPIGSFCIKRFERPDMFEEVTIKEQLFKLLHHLEDNWYIEFGSQLFSRRLLEYLFQHGAFDNPKYSTPQRNYDFLLGVFNARKKPAKGSTEEKRVNALVAFQLKPYLHKELNDKIRKPAPLRVKLPPISSLPMHSAAVVTD
jgi:hypothetical protein